MGKGLKEEDHKEEEIKKKFIIRIKLLTHTLKSKKC